MEDNIKVEKSFINEIINRRNLGDKKFHSDTSINEAFGDDGPARQDPLDDPGVQNSSMNVGPSYMKTQARRRTRSTPGPESGDSLVTASAARAERRRVNYHPDVEQTLSAERLSRLPPSKFGDESGTATPIGNGLNTFPNYNSNNRNADAKSINSYRMYTPSGTPYRKRSEMMMDAQSIRSVETQAPPPTNPQDNKRLTARYITLIVSSMYAVAIVTLGLIIYLADQFIELSISPIYTLILIIIGFLYHVYIMIDVQIYKKKTQANQKKKYQYEEAVAEYFRRQEEDFPSLNQESRLPGIPPPGLVPLKHDYCFSRGRHSGSFYLKLGAAGFALGHLIHSVLVIVVELSYLTDNEIDNDECMDYAQLVVDILNPLYCFVQLYFVFKYSNVIVLKKQGLAHIAFMHIIGSSLCFWISAIIRETILALTLYAQSKYGNEDGYYVTPNNTEGTIGFTQVKPKIIDIDGLYNENCVGSQAISSIFQQFSPYLYPFSIEFNILIVAVYFIIWSNIGKCPNEDNTYSEIYNSSTDDSNSVCKIPTANEDNDFTSNLVIYADCHASNRGLFAGLLVMVVIAGMLILGFVFKGVDEDFQGIGALLSDCTKLSLHTAMLFCCIIAFMQTKKLDINEHPVSLLDDILLFVCIPPFFMETVLSLVATVTILNWVKSFDFIIMLIQTLVQTPLIMDGLRRCSNSRKLRRGKPGRELMMFLIITNVAMWLFYTFSYKSPERFDERYEFYGKELWTILGHVSLPLIMFYRFHSSVCFADIWDSAYKPGAEH